MDEVAGIGAQSPQIIGATLQFRVFRETLQMVYF
jgi:hypothetical protein